MIITTIESVPGKEIKEVYGLVTASTVRSKNIGKDIGAGHILRNLVDNGHNLILFTMRSDDDNGPSEEFPDEHGGNYLSDAINWFKINNIRLYGIQKNPTQTWTSSPKAYGQLYIDDAALGVPLKHDSLSERPYVDWDIVKCYLHVKNIL